MTITLTVTVGAEDHTVSVPDDATIAQLKENITSVVGRTGFRLIFGGRILRDAQSLADAGLKDGLSLHCVGGTAAARDETVAGGGAAASGSVVSPPAGTARAGQQADTGLAPALNDAVAARRASGEAGASSNTALEAALQRLAPSSKMDCLRTLSKIVGNIIAHPHEAKYRSVKTSNAAIQRKIVAPGGVAVLLAMGFEQAGGVISLTPTAEAWEVLQAGHARLASASAAAAPGGGASGASGGAGGAGGAPPPPPSPLGLPGMGGMQPALLQQAVQAMSDPRALEQILSNPMAQAAASQNPLMAQALDQMRTNPAMMQQMQSVMQNPQMMEQMMQSAQTMFNQQQAGQGPGPIGGLGGLGGTAPAMPPGAGAAAPPAAASAAAPAPAIAPAPAAAPAAAAPAPTPAQTEEDMIAEAIARSLRGDEMD
eukprot:g2411.t1